MRGTANTRGPGPSEHSGASVQLTLLQYIRAFAAALSKPPRLPEPKPDPMAAAYASAELDIGEREDPMGSNSGPYVEGLRDEAKLSQLGFGQWCAVFCTVHSRRFGIDIQSRGAKKLVKQLAKAGRAVSLRDLKPGMCGLSLHKRRGGWHVRFWRCIEEHGVLKIECVGGNERHAVRSGKFSAMDYTLTAKKMATI